MNESLANPVWASLISAHQHLAQTVEHVLRYPTDIAPFAAVESARVSVAAGDLLRLASEVYFVGVLPQVTGVGFKGSVSTVLQMAAPGMMLSSAVDRLPEEVVLLKEDGADMMELTSVAFPGFFRPRTGELGRYVGIRKGDQLVAMAGERMRMHGLREISAVCTRPGFTGQGFAKHLIRRLMASEDPAEVFLHVGASNTRAAEIYRSVGFEVCNAVEVLHLVRSD